MVMKKYKLIKEYPGSPKLGTEIEKKTIYSDKWMFTRDCNLFPVTSGTPDDYPEFWEEVIELCVPIGTKFKHRGGNQIYFISKLEDNIVTVSWFKNRCNILTYHLKNVNNWFKEGTWIEYKEPEYEILTWYFGDMNITKDPDGTASKYFIHSIKRLSDGEIFTIGDRTKKGTILAFDTPGANKLEARYKVNESGFGWRMLKEAVKVKEPIFITEDGVEIYNINTNLFGVFNKINGYPVEKHYVLRKNSFEYFKDYGLIYWKIFSTEENADKYIKENKPMFSYNDIMYGYRKCTMYDANIGDLIDGYNFDKYLINITNERYKK